MFYLLVCKSSIAEIELFYRDKVSFLKIECCLVLGILKNVYVFVCDHSWMHAIDDQSFFLVRFGLQYLLECRLNVSFG